MQIYKSPTTDLTLCDYSFRGKNYRSVAPMVFFRLSTSTIVDATESMAAIIEKFPNISLDAGLPKPCGEWSIYGDAIRDRLDIEHSLIEITMGKSSKTVMVDFSKKYKLRLSLDNTVDARTRFFLYEESLLGFPYTKLVASFTDEAMDSSIRLPLAGTYGKSYLQDEWPNLPKDFNFAFNLVSPRDQRIEGFWSFGDYYSLSGVVPALYGGFFKGYLPSIDLRVYMHHMINDAKHELIPGILNFDTIKFFPDLDLGVMIWHSIFVVDKDADFDTLLVLDAKDLSSKDENGKEIPPTDQEILALAIAQHPKKEQKKHPKYAITKKIAEVKKESRAIKHARYCNVYLDYYRCIKAYGEFPVIEPLYRDRFGNGAEENVRNFLDIYTEVSKKQIDDSLPFVQALNGNILPEEKNFNTQLSALIYGAQKNNKHEEFLKFLAQADLRDFSVRRYLLSYLPKPQIHRYVDWGIGVDESRTFTIPSGILIPIFMDDVFTSAMVLSQNYTDESDVFIIPGSELKNNGCWFNHLGSDYYPRFICNDIVDALRLNEETLHYLNPIALQNPNDEIPKPLEKNINESKLVLIPAKNGEEQIILEKWHDFHTNIKVVSLGFHEDGSPYNSLRERLTSNESIESWLQPYLSFQIEEPDYLSKEQYEAAFDNVFAKRLNQPLGKLDITKARDNLLEEQRQKVLDYCKTKELKDKTNEAFDKAKIEMHKYDNASEEEIMQAHLDAQRKNIEDTKNLLTKNKNISEQSDVSADAYSSVLEDITEQEIAYQEFLMFSKKADKELDTVKAEFIEINKRDADELARAYNLKAEDLDSLKAIDHLENSELYLADRDYVDCDYRKMSFKNSNFDNINFIRTNLSFCNFEGSTFTNCCFDACILRCANWKNCTFINCKLQNGIAEENDYTGAEFLAINIKNFSHNKAIFKDASFSAGTMQSTSFMECSFDNIEYSFTEINSNDFLKCKFNNFILNNVVISVLNFRDSEIKKFRITDSSIEKFSMLESVCEQFEINESILKGAIINKNYIKIANFSESDMQELDISKTVLVAFYANNSNFYNSKWVQAVAKQSIIKQCNMQQSDFTHVNLLCSSLAGCRLGKANFEEANLFGCDFTNAKILDNNFKNANLKRTLLTGFEYQEPISEVLSFKW